MGERLRRTSCKEAHDTVDVGAGSFLIDVLLLLLLLEW